VAVGHEVTCWQGDMGTLVQGAGWHVGMLARGEAEQVKGTSGQGDTGTRGRYRDAKSYRGKDTGARRSRETKYRFKNSGWGGTVGNLSR
jgi:hypothetical protein